MPDEVSPEFPPSPPGWYANGGQQRYWNGTQWTAHFAPLSVAPTFVQIVRTPTNGLALASLVLGIISVAFGWVPGLGPLLTAPVWILAVIFGGLGVANAKKLGGLRLGMAWTGLWLGLSPIIISFVWAVIRGLVSAATN
jgi:hypothetical protein